jgi:hypothetical protein
MSEDDAYRLREGKGVAGGNPHLRKPKHRLMQVSLQSGKPLFEGFRVAKRAEAPAVTDVGLPGLQTEDQPEGVYGAAGNRGPVLACWLAHPLVIDDRVVPIGLAAIMFNRASAAVDTGEVAARCVSATATSRRSNSAALAVALCRYRSTGLCSF